MIRRILSSKKGASSIMVMLMLVVLVVFGVAALTTALSNMRLGQKVADWNDKYYAAESEANERFARIDKAVELSFGKSGDIADNIQQEINYLDFNASVGINGESIDISYETWSGDIGIKAVLSLDVKDKNSLRAVQWKEIQK